MEWKDNDEFSLGNVAGGNPTENRGLRIRSTSSIEI